MEADIPNLGQPRRLGPLGGAKPKRPTYELPTPPTTGPGQSLLGAGTQPVADWFAFKRPTPTYASPGRSLPGAGTQLVTDRFAYYLPNLPTSGQGRLPAADQDTAGA